MATVSIKQVWTFQSDTNVSKTYETLQYLDNSTSCNCPGWTRRINQGVRTCKHTRYVDQGVASRYSLTTHQYSPQMNDNPFNNIATSQTRTKSPRPEPPVKKPVPQEEPEKKLTLKPVASGRRKIVW